MRVRQAEAPPVAPASAQWLRDGIGLDAEDAQVIKSLTQDQLALEQSRSIAQANNPTSGSFLRPSSVAPHVNSLQQNDEAIALSLCDGIGCLAMVLQRIRAKLTKYIAVENDDFSCSSHLPELQPINNSFSRS